MTTTTGTVTLTNDLWEVEIAPALNGRVVRLADRRTGLVCVQAPEGAKPAAFFGLEVWAKGGETKDPSTGVLSAFASIHRAPADAEVRPDGVTLTTHKNGLALTLEWSLPAGEAPLRCKATLVNESAPAGNFQFEGFFLWHRPKEARRGSALLVPGLAPFTPAPYLEVRYGGGDGSAPCAAWWQVGGQAGVALRAGAGVERFFYGLEGHRFVLGPHSRRAQLQPGDSLAAEFEIAPLTHARARGWPLDIPAAEEALAQADARREARARGLGSLQEWATAPEPFFERRAMHLIRTPAGVNEAIRSLERIAPAGFNMLFMEIGDAYPYRSHPEVTPEWAWSRAQWEEYLNAARSLGIEPIPLINSLGHQTETGLGLAHPEMREDPDGWCLCPQHPDTLRCLCEMIDELIDLFQPRAFHVGLDEADMPGRPQTFCVCPKCKDTDGGELFANHILGLHEHITGQGLEMLMWPDMLLWEPRQNQINGLRTGTWRAIDRLPRDIILVDWIYGVVKEYVGTRYFLDHGFRVMGATWNEPLAVADYARFAADHQMYGMCATTWAGMLLPNWPLDCLLLGGKYFQDPYYPDFARAAEEAKTLAYVMAEE